MKKPKDISMRQPAHLRKFQSVPVTELDLIPTDQYPAKLNSTIKPKASRPWAMLGGALRGAAEISRDYTGIDYTPARASRKK